MLTDEFTRGEAEAIFKAINSTNFSINCSQCRTKDDWYITEIADSRSIGVRCGKCKQRLHRNVLDMLPDEIPVDSILPGLDPYLYLGTGKQPNDPDILETHKFEFGSMSEAVKELFDTKKFDQGKVMAGVLEDFLPALSEVAKLGSMNNKPFGKYERGSWMEVENAEQRYLDGFWRHICAGRLNIDPETDMPHDVAIAWNALALIWFRLKREGKL